MSMLFNSVTNDHERKCQSLYLMITLLQKAERQWMVEISSHERSKILKRLYTNSINITQSDYSKIMLIGMRKLVSYADTENNQESILQWLSDIMLMTDEESNDK